MVTLTRFIRRIQAHLMFTRSMRMWPLTKPPELLPRRWRCPELYLRNCLDICQMEVPQIGSKSFGNDKIRLLNDWLSF